MNKTLILVVEDDRPIRNLIVTTLKTHDYKYLAAENGFSAILEASSHNPDIVLLDLGLPDMEGVEVIKKIRTWSNMPIIVISARSEDTDKIEALDAGADDYITKPFSVEELLARIRVSQRRIAITQAMASTAAAPPSRWPVMDLVEDTLTLYASSPNAFLMAMVSYFSLSGVEVPCALI